MGMAMKRLGITISPFKRTNKKQPFYKQIHASACLVIGTALPVHASAIDS
jgi:hypothetical protein